MFLEINDQRLIKKIFANIPEGYETENKLLEIEDNKIYLKNYSIAVNCGTKFEWDEENKTIKPYTMRLPEYKKIAHSKIIVWYERLKSGIPGGIFSKVLQSRIDCSTNSVSDIRSVCDYGTATGVWPAEYKLFDNTKIAATPEQFQACLIEMISVLLSNWQQADAWKIIVDDQKSTTTQIDEIIHIIEEQSANF